MRRNYTEQAIATAQVMGLFGAAKRRRRMDRRGEARVRQARIHRAL
ncbi:hypothetical protein [Bauldia sp.]